MVIRTVPLPLPNLLPPAARGFAVLDLETTGTGHLCCIVEIAVLLLKPDGELQQEWTTLIHPGVPIPNAAVHGIDDALVAAAPSFAEVGPELVALLEGHVLVAHNLNHFDGPILRHHLWEASNRVPELVVDLGDGIDTMPNPFVGLGKLCSTYGISLSQGDAHTALGDTRALAALLRCGLPHLQPSVAAVRSGRANTAIPGSAAAAPRQPCVALARQRHQSSHDWLPATAAVPAAGGTIALLGEDARGWDYKAQKGLERAKTLGLILVPLDPDAPADLLVVSSVFIDSPLMRRLRTAGLAVVESKAFLQAEGGQLLPARRWGPLSPAAAA
jgi:DNA polymerase III epsilon subunit-like protein